MLLVERSTPGTPSANTGLLYVKDNGSGSSAPYFLSDDGIEIDLSGGGGGATTLDALDDVTILSEADDQVMQYNSGTAQWENVTLAHSTLSGIGTNTHTQIDTHIANTSNPHSVTAAQAGAVALTGNETVAGVKTFSSLPLSSVVPTTGDQLVNKTYVDTFALGLVPKESCRVATTTAGTLATDFENGDTIDGVVLATNDRILIKDQADATTNGIYTVNASGAPTRATDSDASAEVQEGTFTFVSSGTANGSKQFVQITIDPTLGASDLVYTQLQGSTPITASLGVERVADDFRADLLSTGAITLSGNELLVNVDDSSIERSANALQVKALGVTNAMLAGSIDDSKLSTITTAGKVSGAALTSLSSIPSGAGVVPVANLATGTPDGTKFVRDDGTLAVPATGAASVNAAIMDVDFLSANRSGTTEQTATWSNMPAATTELFGNTSRRIKIDLTYATHYRIVVDQVTAGVAGADFNLQYSSDNVTYAAADTAAAGEVDVGTGTGLKIGAWADVVSGVQNDVYLRIVGKQGNGTADPVFRQIRVQFKMLSSGGSSPANATYVTLSANGTLTEERVLTGTSNQITITDNGAGSTVVLSTPQNLHTAATPTFSTVTVDDEAYGAGWDGALTVPTKNAVYDKIQTLGAGAGADTALSNLASVAINTSLISDTDITDDLGSLAIRWKSIYSSVLSTGDTATDTLLLQAYDSDGATGVTFMTLTAGNTPTATISNVTSSTNFNPTSNDGSALGASGTAWSDFFIATGGVINFGAGNSTITHSAGVLTTNARIISNLGGVAQVPQFLSGSASFYTAMQLGRVVGEVNLAIAAAAGTFSASAAAGDFIIQSAGGSIILNANSSGGAILFNHGASDVNIATIDASGLGIGTTNPTTSLHIYESNTSTTVPQIYVEQDSTGDAALEFGIVGDSYIMGIDNSAADIFTIAYDNTQGGGVLGTGNLITLDASGQMSLFTADNGTGLTIKINATQANVTTADIFMSFNSTTGAEGTIAGTAVAGVIAYNTFTGSHYTIIEDKTNLEVGMVLEVINEKITEFPAMRDVEAKDENGEMVKTGEKYAGASPKNHLMKARICNTIGSKAALGVYGGTDNDGRDLVLSIGTGIILVKNSGIDIEIGDYLISSQEGRAELQGDDSYTNKTLAKAMENVVWAGEKEKLINCIYLGG